MLTVKKGAIIKQGNYEIEFILRPHNEKHPSAVSFIRGEFVDKELVFGSGAEETTDREYDYSRLKYVNASNWATRSGFDITSIESDQNLVMALVDALQKMIEIAKRNRASQIYIDFVAEVPSSIGRAVNVHCIMYE